MTYPKNEKERLTIKKPYSETQKHKHLTIALRLPDTKEKLAALAKKDKRSLNNLINVVLEKYIEDHE